MNKEDRVDEFPTQLVEETDEEYKERLRTLNPFYFQTMSKGIRISKQYGFNPSVTRCFCCGKEYGLAICGTAQKDPKTGKTAEAPREVYQGLCDDCQRVVDQEGVIVLEVKDNATGKNPERTGRMVGCSKEFKERNHIESPIIYMEETVFSNLFNEYIGKEQVWKK